MNNKIYLLSLIFYLLASYSVGSDEIDSLHCGDPSAVIGDVSGAVITHRHVQVIKAPSAGTILISLDNGDAINTESVIGNVESLTEENQIVQLESQLLALTADRELSSNEVIQAKRNLAQGNKLMRDGASAISSTELQNLEYAYENAKLQFEKSSALIENMKSKIQEVSLTIQKKTIVAPFVGIFEFDESIHRSHVSEGDHIGKLLSTSKVIRFVTYSKNNFSWIIGEKVYAGNRESCMESEIIFVSQQIDELTGGWIVESSISTADDKTFQAITWDPLNYLKIYSRN